MTAQNKQVVICDFCGKDQHAVAHMMTGPGYWVPAICSECVDLCVEIIAERRAKAEAGDARS